VRQQTNKKYLLSLLMGFHNRLLRVGSMVKNVMLFMRSSCCKLNAAKTPAQPILLYCSKIKVTANSNDEEDSFIMEQFAGICQASEFDAITANCADQLAIHSPKMARALAVPAQ
jgi:hypothetical protein